jgi:hypothetical protein
MKLTLRSALIVAGVVLMLLILAACGSLGPRGFHSARQTYSVREVERAFSDHGLSLSKLGSPPLPGVTALSHGRGANEVAVSVISPQGGTLYAPARTYQRSTLHGNVAVGFPLRDSGAVRAALRELH